MGLLLGEQDTIPEFFKYSPNQDPMLLCKDPHVAINYMHAPDYVLQRRCPVRMHTSFAHMLSNLPIRPSDMQPKCSPKQQDSRQCRWIVMYKSNV